MWLGCAACIACDDRSATDAPPDVGTAPDAAAASDARSAEAGLSEPPAAPAPPEPPRLVDWLCPQAWSATTLGEGEDWQHDVCDPPPVPRCAGAEVAWLDGEGCGRLGSECPPGDAPFHDEATLRALAPEFAGPVVYIQPDAPEDGHGTVESPFASFEAAFESGPQDGAILALATGDHDSFHQVVDRRAAIVGACVEKTRIRREVPEEPPEGELRASVALFRPGGSLLTNLTVSGADAERGGIVVVDTTEPVTIREVLIEESWSVGLAVAPPAAEVVVERVVIRATRRSASGRWGLGIWAQAGAPLRLLDVVVEEAHHGGLWLEPPGRGPGAHIQADGLVVRETGGHGDGPDRQRPTAVVVAQGAALELRRGWLVDNEQGLVAFGRPGSPLTEVLLEDVQIASGPHPALSPTGLVRVQGERLVLSAEDSAGIETRAKPRFDEPLVSLKDAVVRGAGEFGMVVFHGRVEAERLVLLDNTGSGASAHAHAPALLPDGEPGELMLSDVVVTGTRPLPGFEAGSGWGLGALDGGRLTAERVLATRNHHAGVIVAEIDGRGAAEAQLTDLVVQDTTAAPSGVSGAGIFVQGGGRLTLRRALVERSVGHGVAVHQEPGVSAPTVLSAEDLLVRETAGRDGLREGVALAVVRRSEATLRRARLTGAHAFGVAGIGSADADAELDFEDVAIDDIRRAACGSLPAADVLRCVDGTKDRSGGLGILAQRTRVRMERFSVTGCAQAGIYMGPGATLEVSHGEVTGNPIGLYADVADFDAGGIGDEVWVFGNGEDFYSEREVALPDTDGLLQAAMVAGAVE